jgi:hypothetical protein
VTDGLLELCEPTEASIRVKLTEREVKLVTSSALWKVTLRIASWYCDSVAVPVSSRVLVELSKAALMDECEISAPSTSPATTGVSWMVTELRLVSSRSVTIAPAAMVRAGSP